MKEPVRNRFPISVEMYHLMAEKGVFAPDDRVELIEGELFEMSPIGSLHVRCVNVLNEFFVRALPDMFLVSVQNPFISSSHSEPQPDLTILKRTADLYKIALPVGNDVAIVIEVSDTTATFDRKRKLPTYAAAGIPEAWLVDLRAGHVEVHTEPTPDGYNAVKIYRRGDNAVSKSIVGVNLSVDDILG